MTEMLCIWSTSILDLIPSLGTAPRLMLLVVVFIYDMLLALTLAGLAFTLACLINPC